jgi:hypothetical protein
MILILLASIQFSSCDSLATELYNVEASFKQISACSCIRKTELDDFKSTNKKIIKESSICSDLEERVDSLKQRMKVLRKKLR